MKQRKAPDTMTGYERVEELGWFFTGPGSIIEVPFDVMHERMEALMGRPVWTHEFADTTALMAEAECRFLGANCEQAPKTPFDALADREVIVVVADKP